jgi:hypothetical protein
MYLVYCLLGNVLDLAPMPMAAGSMKPVKPAATILITWHSFPDADGIARY